MNNEMTTEYMSNEEVIEVLKGLVFGSFDRTTRKERQALDLAIKVLEEKQGKWIPVSERLPNLWAIVLVTDESDNVYEYERRPLDENGNEYNEWCFLGRKIIAWMPLPEPYKEGGAE